MGKKLWYQIKSDLILETIAVLGSALLGFLICAMVVLWFNVDKENGYVMIMTLFALMFGGIANIIVGFGNMQKSVLAIMFGQTRKQFWGMELIGGVIEMTWTGILAGLVYGIDCLMQKTIYSGYKVEMSLTPFFRFLAGHPLCILIVFASFIFIRVLIETLSIKFGPTSFFAIWVVGCFSFSALVRVKVIQNFLKYLVTVCVKNGASGSFLLYEFVAVLIFGLLIVSLTLLTRKQEVY